MLDLHVHYKFLLHVYNLLSIRSCPLITICDNDICVSCVLVKSPNGFMAVLVLGR